MAMVGIVVVILIVAVLAGLYLGKVGPFAPSSSSSSSPGEAFSAAASSAQSAASGQSGGPWTPVGGEGFDFSTSSTQNTSALASMGSEAGCSISLLSGAPATVTLASTSSSISSGNSAGWAIELAGKSSLLFVYVTSSGATPIATFGGSSCPLFGSYVSISLPSDTISSSAAVQAALNAGGDAYLTNHTKVDVLYTLSPQVAITTPYGSSVTAASWSIELSNCDLSGTTGKSLDGQVGTMFTVNVNATTAVAGKASTSLLTCPTSSSSTTSASDLKLGNWVEAGPSPHYFYNATVQSTPSGITWNELAVSVLTSGGAKVTGPIEVNVTNLAGTCIDATWSFSTGAWSAPSSGGCSGTIGGSTDVTAGEEFQLVSASSIGAQGDELVLTGQGALAGASDFTIP
jgi:hypothetical protein